MKAESSDLIPLKSNQEVVGYTSKHSLLHQEVGSGRYTLA